MVGVLFFMASQTSSVMRPSLSKPEPATVYVCGCVFGFGGGCGWICGVREPPTPLSQLDSI